MVILPVLLPTMPAEDGALNPAELNTLVAAVLVAIAEGPDSTNSFLLGE